MTMGPGRLPDPGFWAGRRVLITGHTGFKGSWLVRWLSLLGAEVHGLALDPPSRPALFEVAGVAGLLQSDHRVDVRDADRVDAVARRVAPDVLLHLAAQSLVRDGYRDPAGTIATNVAGTANVLAAVSWLGTAVGSRGPSAVVVVTTDKVYRPDPSGRPHREDDPLGGDNPYAASKVMAEAVAVTFRGLPPIDGRPAWSSPVATVRAGNVIGGGDWSHERLLPDCVRAFAAGRDVVLRFPNAVRPWQHVLDPLAAYLLLAEELATRPAGAPTTLNVGPSASGDATVAEVAAMAAEAWGGPARVREEPRGDHPPETGLLRLDSSRATANLGWQPRWDVRTAVERTVDWHLAHMTGDDMAEMTDSQIREYADA